MKIEYVPAHSKTQMPAPKSSGWGKGEVETESLLIRFDDPIERVNGGILVPVSVVENIIQENRISSSGVLKVTNE